MLKSSFVRTRWIAGLALLLILLAHATGRLKLAPLDALERQLIDARLAWTAPTTVDERIVIIDIDDHALAAVGRWPWPRKRLAELVERCFDHGALLLGLDLILAEPDDDGLLSDALQRHPVVLGFYLAEQPYRSAVLPPPLLPARGVELSDWPGYGGNVAQLQDAAGQAGFLNALNDADGITRSGLLVARQGESLYGSLPLVMAQQLLGAGTPEIIAMNGTMQGLQLNTSRGPRFLATSSRGEVIVPYRADTGQFARVSAARLLDPHEPADRLRAALSGKVLLIGASAAGLMDRLAMPLQPSYAGVDVHASLLSGLLEGALPHVRADAPALTALELLLIGAVLLLALPRLSVAAGLALSAGLLALLIGHGLWAWRVQGEAWPLASPTVFIFFLAGLHLLLEEIKERIARRRLQALFGQYMPASRVEAMAREADRDSYTLESRSAELTVLFADVRGFAGIAEQLPPGELAGLMNAYFSAMSDVIGMHRGTLDKYIGDAVMAFWGAPQDDPQHARNAVLAAQAMLARLAVLNQDFAARGWPQIAISIGINTGAMVVGDLGSSTRRAYTVLGHAVNVAARLQELCVAQGVNILIGETTEAQAGLPTKPLGRTALRGQRTELMIFSPE